MKLAFCLLHCSLLQNLGQTDFVYEYKKAIFARFLKNNSNYGRISQ